MSYAETTTPTKTTVYRAIPNPDANLRLGKSYVATVTTGAKDLAGNGLYQGTAVPGSRRRPGPSSP